MTTNNKATLPDLADLRGKVASRLQDQYSNLLRSIQLLITMPAYPFLISGVAWLVIIFICWGMMP